jgi:cob(I)alamin adenosyltransferase
MTDPQTSTHKAKMQALKAEQKRKTSEAVDPERGLVLVHTGNGKGKSSSAFGVIARALGWGHRVGVVQFIKGKWVTGEQQFFERFPEEVAWHTMGDGFTWNTQNAEQDAIAANAALAKGADMMASGKFELIVMDEINIALRYDYIDVADVIAALNKRSDKTGVILTGRDARPELMEYADLVSEMLEIKHPFSNAGIKAQQGIDF